jgi:hypothetical protein
MQNALGTAVFFLITGTAQAAIITADADDFTSGASISNAYAGLTLSFEGSTSSGVNDGIIYSVDQSGGIVASTGSRVFGTSDPTYPNLFSGITTAVFRVDFTQTATSISVDALGDNGSDFAQLNAYTSSGLLVDSYFTGQLTTGHEETMTVGGADIAYILAAGVGNDAVGFDNLVAQVVPVPAAIWMFASALGGLSLRRRMANHKTN